MDSTTTKRTIVVLGATGQQGGAVAQALVTDGRWQVRALSRDPASHGARLLSVAGIEVVRADMDDLDSLQHAMAGAYGVFSVQGTDSLHVRMHQRESQPKVFENLDKIVGVRWGGL